LEVSLSSSKIKNKIKAILFDLDGTLLFNLPTAGEVFLEHLHSLGVAISQEERILNERWEYQYFASSLEVQEDYFKYKGDLKAFRLNYSKRRLLALGLSIDRVEALAPLIFEHMHASYRPQAHIPDEVFALLKHLQEAGYVTAVVSNRDVSFQEELADLKLDSYFHFTVAAGVVQSYKPDVRIFQHALELAGTSASETMYVGDNYYADVVGALRAGLRPVLYDPTHLFPEAEAECTVIQHYSEFYGLLK
jgi:HAD superfamily hydrolase (TIGR01549 family)